MVPVEVRVEASAPAGESATEGDAPSGEVFMLLEPWGERTWLASLGDRLVIARRVSDLSEIAPAGLSGSVGSAVAFASRSPNLIPLIGLRAAAGALWLLSELDPGLPVQRMLEVTRLSPLQATVAAKDILAGVGALHDGGAGHGRIKANNVLMGRTGSARLGDWAMEKVLPSSKNGEAQEVDLVETGALLRTLVESARRSRHGLLDEDGYLAVLDSVAKHIAYSTSRNGAIRSAVETLNTCTNGGDQRARAELASLVAALTKNPRWARYVEPPAGADGNGHGGNGHTGNGHGGNGRAGNGHAGNGHGGNGHGGHRQAGNGHNTLVHDDRHAGNGHPGNSYTVMPLPSPSQWVNPNVIPLPTPPDVADEQRPPGRVRTELNRAWRMARLPVVVLMLVLLIVGIELAFLHNTIAKQLNLVFAKHGTTHHSASASSSPSAGGSNSGLVPDAGPSSAGAITGMDLRGIGPCTAGSTCQLRLLVLLQPSSSTQRLRWEFQVVDRCSGHTIIRPGNMALARPDQSYVDTLSQVAMPSGSSLAVVAVTSSPAKAASQPWLVGSGGPCGPPARAGTT